MSRHRARIPSVDESSSDSDDDIFASLSKKEGVRTTKRPHKPKAKTSSNKRHHGVKTTTKQTKMDAVLEELQKSTRAAENTERSFASSVNKSTQGSFVDPDHEHVTTNLFVGNLPLSIDESVVGSFFSRFGDLYSIKIMWPRETGHFNSVNGFVCFQERSAAEEAARYCRVNPCFGGRQLRIGWGKPILQPQQQSSASPEQKEPARHLKPGEVLGGAELREFTDLMQNQLMAPSRQVICRVMAFCFDKSRAARHICHVLKDLVLADCPVDTTIAQLYLLSDILYNSQQPGIRNAFLYRDALQQMVPSVFAHWRDLPLGRLGRDRLSNAVSAVLAAWTNWGVYDPAYLDELDTAYSGRKVAPPAVNTETADATGPVMRCQSDIPVDKVNESAKSSELLQNQDSSTSQIERTIPGHSLAERTAHMERTNNENDGVVHHYCDPDDIDGEPLEDDDDIDGEPLDDDIDGEPLDDGDDLDGQPVEDGDDVDGEPLEDGEM